MIIICIIYTYDAYQLFTYSSYIHLYTKPLIIIKSLYIQMTSNLHMQSRKSLSYNWTHKYIFRNFIRQYHSVVRNCVSKRLNDQLSKPISILRYFDKDSFFKPACQTTDIDKCFQFFSN